MTAPTISKHVKWLLPAIILITLAVFSTVLGNDFVNLDDPFFVYANPKVRAGVTLDAIRWAFTENCGSNWVPLAMLSHMLDVQLFGMDPIGHHFVNLLFHVASSVLLFLFLNRATKASLPSAAVAFLFALHPLHVESVAWVSERRDVLSAFFWMSTLYAYVLYTERPGIPGYFTVLFLFTLGLLSKPMVVTLPTVLLLLDWWPLGRLSAVGEGNDSCRRSSPLRLIVEKIPLFLLAFGVSSITYLVKQATGEIVTEHSVQERVARACISYIEYLYKMIWPSDLAVFYPTSKFTLSTTTVILSAFALVLISGAVFRMRKRYPFLITGWFWYIVSLLPVIGLIRSGASIIADRFTYIPLIGIFMVIAWGIPRFLAKWSQGAAIAGTAFIGILLLMIILTSLQLRYWKNSYTLMTHAIETTEDNWLAQNNLGLVFLGEGRIDEAILHFQGSLTAKPSYVLALLNLGSAYSIKNEPERSIVAFKQALQFEPGNEKAHLALGLMYLQAGQKGLAAVEYQALQESASAFAPYLLNMINAGAINIMNP